jgi:hypothetical protein
MSIKGYYRQEERYIGLNLSFEEASEKEKILKAIEDTKKEVDVDPSVFDSNKDDGTGGVYIEFNDDYDKESGDFLEGVLAKLGIKCECDDTLCECK